MEILHAMRILLEHRMSGAPVVDADGRLVGVLSKKDCLRAALQGAYHQEWGGQVATFMSTDPETLDADLDLVIAAERVLASLYRRFPVLRDGAVVGQISRADILRALLENWSPPTAPRRARERPPASHPPGMARSQQGTLIAPFAVLPGGPAHGARGLPAPDRHP